jgi:hypothetical protein
MFLSLWYCRLSWAGSRSRDGRSGDRIPVWARLSASVQTGHGAHPAPCTMVTGSFLGVKRPGLGVDYVGVDGSRKSRAIPVLPLYNHLKGFYFYQTMDQVQSEFSSSSTDGGSSSTNFFLITNQTH